MSGVFRNIVLNALGEVQVSGTDDVITEDISVVLDRLSNTMSKLVEEQKETNKLLKKIYNPQ